LSAIYSDDEHGDISIDFEHYAMKPVNSLLTVNRRLSEIELKNLKRYLFLSTFEWNRNDNGFSSLTPVSVVVDELDNWLDYTYYEYLVLYTSLGVWKHTKYTLNDFLSLSFKEIHKITESCKFIIDTEERIKNTMKKDGDPALGALEDEEDLL